MTMFISDNQIDLMHRALQMCRDAGITNIMGMDTVDGDCCQYVCTYGRVSQGGIKQVRVFPVRHLIEPVEGFVESEDFLR